MKKFIATTLSSITIAASLMGGTVAAAGNGSLSMSPANANYTVGNTITTTITENSGTDSVNVIQADFTYDASKLQFVSASCGGAFEIAASVTANGITCGTTTPKSGAQTAGTVNFKAVAAGTAVVSFSGSSHMYNTANVDIWNGSTAGATYTISNPVVTPPVTPPTTPPSTPPATGGTGNTGGSTGSTGSTGNTGTNGSTGTGTSTGSTGTGTGTTTPGTPAPVTPPTTGTVEGASTTTYTVVVRVYDHNDNEVKGAQVTLNGKTAVTDKSGKASFTGIKAGSYTVKAVSGNKEVSSSIKVQNKNKTTQNYMVTLPRAKRNRFGFILGTTALIAGIAAAIYVIGRKLLARSRTALKTAAPVAATRKTTVRRTAKPVTRLTTASAKR